jgi:hypothetical protein
MVTLHLDKNSRVVAKVEQPTTDDIVKWMDELSLGNGDLMSLDVDGNYLFLCNADQRWFVTYSGISGNAFVNSILVDLGQADSSEVEFICGGQGVYHPINWTVDLRMAREVVIEFALRGKLATPPGCSWHYTDELPLSE